MPRDGYQEELDTLREDVKAMGELVLGQFDRGLDALIEGDEVIAEAVVEDDQAVNERYRALESNCIELFALQQPVATDLRVVAGSFKVLTDLERVGDLATNLAQYATGDRSDRFGGVDLALLGAEARSMLADALTAYAEADAALSRAVAERDDDLDALCQRASERVVRDLIEHGAAGPWEAETVLDDVSRLLLAIRDLERVGDHAVNVAARALYVAEGDSALV
jgi:phosphate transport system protein